MYRTRRQQTISTMSMIPLYGLTDIIVDYFFQALIGVDAVEKKISIQKIIVSTKR